MSAEIFNIFSPAKERHFQKQNRTEKNWRYSGSR